MARHARTRSSEWPSFQTPALIALARIQRLDLLPAIFESVLTRPAVARKIASSIPVLSTRNCRGSAPDERTHA